MRRICFYSKKWKGGCKGKIAAELMAIVGTILIHVDPMIAVGRFLLFTHDSFFREVSILQLC
jgi:hypothetical protein